MTCAKAEIHWYDFVPLVVQGGGERPNCVARPVLPQVTHAERAGIHDLEVLYSVQDTPLAALLRSYRD